MKSAGVITVAVLAVLIVAVVGMVAGTVVVGGAQGTLVTLSGTSLGVGEALGRIALVAVWTVGQLLAVGAQNLPIEMGRRVREQVGHGRCIAAGIDERPLPLLVAVLAHVVVGGGRHGRRGDG